MGGTLPIRDSRAWHVELGAQVSTFNLFSRSATHRHNAGHSKPRSTRLKPVAVSSDMATQIPVRSLSRVPKCALQKLALSSPKVRDRLCQLIRQHQLDASLVKSYATDFCGVKTLRDATREQVENFVVRLADRAEKDRDALLCQLNSYVIKKEGVA